MTVNSYSYPPARRIRKRKDFLRCYDHGCKYHSRHFLIFSLASGSDCGRFGVTVSRKVGNAVTRNRIKRILREFYRLHAHAARNFDIVAVAKNNAAGLDLDDAIAELMPVIARLAASQPVASSSMP